MIFILNIILNCYPARSVDALVANWIEIGTFWNYQRVSASLALLS